jgi:hypothetical protein
MGLADFMRTDIYKFDIYLFDFLLRIKENIDLE